MAEKEVNQRIVVTKRTRSMVFLIISVMFILGINSLLPLIEGRTHYTVEAVETTYSGFIVMHDEDQRINLTYGSKKDIRAYQEKYMEDNPDEYETYKLVPVPSTFPVEVYTKFFYEYPFWYISTATSLASAIVLFYSLFNYLLIVQKDKDEHYVKLLKDMNKATDGQLHPSTFEPWMDYIFNHSRKVSQHRANIRFLIDKLERKTHYTCKQKLKLYFSAKTKEEKDAALLEVKLNKRDLKYKRKKERLLSLLDEEYIRNFVSHGRVKYFKYIHAAFVYSGVNVVGRTQDSYSLVLSDGEQVTKDASKKVTMSLTITVLFAVVFTVTAVGSVGQDPLTIALNIVSKLAPLMIQIPMSIDYTNKFMENHLIKNLLTRRSITLLYLEDMKKKIPLVDPTLPPKKEEVKVDAKEDKLKN